MTVICCQMSAVCGHLLTIVGGRWPAAFQSAQPLPEFHNLQVRFALDDVAPYEARFHSLPYPLSYVRFRHMFEAQSIELCSQHRCPPVIDRKSTRLNSS